MTGTEVPSYDHVVAAIAEAEQAEGWLSACERDDRFLALSREFVQALVEQLRSAEGGPVLEICAGSGELAGQLAMHGIEVIATDVDPPNGTPVIRADALEALRRYRPATVLGCFVPFDAGVDRAVLAEPCVEHYVVLSARVGGQLGTPLLWQEPAWSGSPLPAVSRWMICRHDVWMGANQPIIQHGEVRLFKRRQAKRYG